MSFPEFDWVCISIHLIKVNKCIFEEKEDTEETRRRNISFPFRGPTRREVRVKVSTGAAKLGSDVASPAVPAALASAPPTEAPDIRAEPVVPAGNDLLREAAAPAAAPAVR